MLALNKWNKEGFVSTCPENGDAAVYQFVNQDSGAHFYTISEEEKVCSYVDIPLQHASGPVLKRMRRGVTRSGQERILSRIRNAIPDVTIRTTFIVGFPGETDKDFDELCDFVTEHGQTLCGA